jgi:hypothetical protein
MSIAPLSTASSSSSGISGRTELSERIATTKADANSTLGNMAEAAADGVSATVSFSGKALHALEQAGETVVDGAEDLAIGAWHAVQAAVMGVEHAGEAVVDTIEDGVHQVVSATESAAQQLGHYAAVGMHATGEAVSEIASGSVLAASAVGKTVMAAI